MKHTIYIKQDKRDLDHSLEVEVWDDGLIAEAHVYLPMFDEWVDCTDKIKKSSFLLKKIDEELNHIKSEKSDYLADKRLDFLLDR